MTSIIPGSPQGQGPITPADPQLSTSVFSYGDNPNPTPGPRSLGELAGYLRACAQTLPHPGPRSLGDTWYLPENKKAWDRVKVQMPAWSPAVFNGTRSNTSVQTVSALVIDFDDISPADLAAFLVRQQAANLAALLYETPSLPRPGTHRLRAVVPFARPLTRKEFPALRRAGLALLRAQDTADPKTKAPSNQFFVPCQRPDGSPALLFELPGQPLDPDNNLQRRAAIALLHQAWPPGTRNAALMAVAGALAGDGIQEHDAHMFLSEVSDDDPQTETIIRNTFSKQANGEPITGWVTLGQIIGKPIVDQARDFLGSVIASTAPFRRGDHTELAGRLHHDIGPTAVHDEGTLWSCGPQGLYEPVTEADQAVRVQSYAGEIVATSGPLRINWSDVTGTIKALASRTARPNFFADAPPAITFSNCTLSIDPITHGLISKPHDPENRARAGYSFAYDPTQYPHRCVKFLQSTFINDADVIQRIEFFQEYIGLCIFGRAAPFETAVVFLSDQGGTAKTTTIDLAIGAMPKGTTSAIPPQLWGDQYRRAQLAGVRLNAVNEFPTSDILDAESFKGIISGNEINARHIREKPFDFKPIAGHLFAANKLPPTPDVSSAFFRRLVILRFTHIVPEAWKIVGFGKYLLDLEKPQLVAWFAQGAARALQRGHLNPPASSQQEVAKWRQNADSVSLFVSKICEKAEHDKDWTSAMRLYSPYRNFCEDGGFKPVNIRNFSQRLVALEIPKDRREAGSVYGIRVRSITALSLVK